MNKELNEFPLAISFDVRWGDMDAFGHVNNVAYFRYFEQARVEYLTKAGFMNNPLTPNIGALIVSSSADYLQPVSYPDKVTIGIKISETGNTSITMEYSLYTEKLGLAAKGKGIIIIYDFEKDEKVVLSDKIIRKLKEI